MTNNIMSIDQARDFVKAYEGIMTRKWGKTPREEQLEKAAADAKRKEILFRGTSLERGMKVVAKKLSQAVVADKETPTFQKVDGGMILSAPTPKTKVTGTGSPRNKGILSGQNEVIAILLHKEYGMNAKAVARVFNNYAPGLTSMKSRSSVKNVLAGEGSNRKYNELSGENRQAIETRLRELGII